MATTGDKFAERTRSKARNIGMRTDRVQQLYVKERVLYRLNEAFQGLISPCPGKGSILPSRCRRSGRGC